MALGETAVGSSVASVVESAVGSSVSSTVESAVGKKEESVPGRHCPSASLVVDIGGDIGALVVIAPQVLENAEIEICPVVSRVRTHTVVRARQLPGGDVVYAGVFPSVPAGEYTLLEWGPMPEKPVTVDGGSVTQINW